MTNGGSSITEVRLLLAVLVASKPGGRIAEVGTAFGDGALAIVSALSPDASFVTVEPDPDRFAHARKALSGTRAEVIHARWQDVLASRAPLDLVFLDGGGADEIVGAVPLVVDLLAPGGILVKDDLTPGMAVGDDPLRAALFREPRLAVVELTVGEAMGVIIATRRR
jgi:predicted O-methyltransferase YrrM